MRDDWSLADFMRSLSQKQAISLMVIVTLVSPFAFLTGGSILADGAKISGFFVMASFWSFGSLEWGAIDLTSFLYPGYIMLTLPFTAINALYSLAVVRYMLGQGQGRVAHAFAALSVLFPLLIGFPGMVSFYSAGILTYSGPVPIQMIVGLILVRYRKPAISSPQWLDNGTESNWWETRP